MLNKKKPSPEKKFQNWNHAKKLKELLIKFSKNRETVGIGILMFCGKNKNSTKKCGVKNARKFAEIPLNPKTVHKYPRSF